MTRPDTSDPQRGSALMAVLLAVVVIGAAGATALAGGDDALARTSLFQDRQAARAAAESGVATARHRLRLDPTWAGGRELIDDHMVDIVVRGLEPDASGTTSWRVRLDARPVRPGHGATWRIDVTLRHAARGSDTARLPAVAAWSERPYPGER